jgi:hypothetical protein
MYNIKNIKHIQYKKNIFLNLLCTPFAEERAKDVSYFLRDEPVVMQAG